MTAMLILSNWGDRGVRGKLGGWGGGETQLRRGEEIGGGEGSG